MFSSDTKSPVATVQATRGLGAIDDALMTPAAILEGLPDAVVAVDSDQRLAFVNGLAEQLFGYPRSELIGEPAWVLWPERHRDVYARQMRLLFDTTEPLSFTSEVWGMRRDGSEFVGEMSRGVVQTTRGPLLLVVGRDLTSRLAVETRLRALAGLGERALTGVDAATLAGEAVAVLHEQLPINGARVRLGDDEILVACGTTTGQAIAYPLVTGAVMTLHTQRPLIDEERSMVRGVIGVLGAALLRLRGEEQTRYDALHDPLTGLANRTLLRDRLQHATAKASRSAASTAVLFIDLDHFKDINDTHGHAVGDGVLIEVAGRLRHAVRPGDTVARFGGDEFVAVCEQVGPAAALAVAGRILDAVHAPLVQDGVHHRLSASIGVALGEGDATALLGESDAAAYRAKAGGRDRIEMAWGRVSMTHP